MSLTSSQSTAFQRLFNSGVSAQAIRLTVDAVRTLVYIAARDLRVLDQLPAPRAEVPEFFDEVFRADFDLPGEGALELFEKALNITPEIETYVTCLASLHKARLKYQEVLATQPFPTIDQVGPRALLQYRQLPTSSLAGLLIWRKWMFDLDNRAAQDTGYLFEPVIAASIGGAPVSARNSPIRRLSDERKGRQVDCLLGKRAYEIKIRITIAASGQGRWGEELSFPLEAKASGYTPILIVLDPTRNPKLNEVEAAYHAAGGETFIGEAAWEHLKDTASSEMAEFIDRYVRKPLDEVLTVFPAAGSVPPLTLTDKGSSVEFSVGSSAWSIERRPSDDASGVTEMPDDIARDLPGIDGE